MNSLAGGSDYQEISALNLDVFDNANRQRSFDVTIIDDSSMEDAESFSLELRFDPFALEPPPSQVILSPNVSLITILDDDEPTAGILLWQQ